MWSIGAWEKTRSQVCVIGKGPESRLISEALSEDKHFVVVPDKDADAALQSGAVKALIVPSAPDEVTIKTHEPSVELLGLTELIQEDIRKARKKSVDKELKDKNVPETVLAPFGMDWQAIKPTAIGTGRSIGLRYVIDILLQFFLLYVIFIMILVGQVAAICLLVEEKEKKTFHTTLLLPVSRTKVMVAKFLAVNLAIASSLFMHLCSLMLSIVFIMAALLVVTVQHNQDSPVLKVLLGQSPIQATDVLSWWIGCGQFFSILKPEIQLPSLPDVAFLLFILFASAALISSCFLFAASFAKSNKDAQTVALFPALTLVAAATVSFIPGLELNFATALLPVSNLLIMRKFQHPEILPASFAFLVLLSLIVFFLWAAKTLFFNEQNSLRLKRTATRHQP